MFEVEFESSLEELQAQLAQAKLDLAELYARGAQTLQQRRLVGELGQQVLRLSRDERQAA